MGQHVLILYHHRLFAEAVRQLLSVEAGLELRAAPLAEAGPDAVQAGLDAVLQTTTPDVVVVERPGMGEPDWALLALVGRVPRVVSLGLADNSLCCVEGTAIASAGPEDLRRTVRPDTHPEPIIIPFGRAAGEREAAMLEVRWHGRGGQGAVMAAKALAAAALADGRHAQAFPEYGPERRGAPVVAFTRLADESIRLFTPVDRPDIVVLLDPTLIGKVGLLDGLEPGGLLLANWAGTPDKLRQVLDTRAHRVGVVHATGIAAELMGKDVPNTVLLGALVRLTSIVSWRALEAELRKAFAGLGAELVEANITAARRGYELVRVMPAEPGLAPPEPLPHPPAPGWRALVPGGTMRPVEDAAAPATSAWRAQRPVLQIERCIHCMFCWVYCPDSAILVQGGRVIGVDYDHCKGCGICAYECPVKPTAIPMVKEDEVATSTPTALAS